jgi:hypothetical protein
MLDTRAYESTLITSKMLPEKKAFAFSVARKKENMDVKTI